MGNSLGRGGRRRRVLNEEIVSASGTHQTMRPRDAQRIDSPNGPVYGEGARVENHLRLSDFIPRHCGTIWLAAFLGAATVAGLLCLDFYSVQLAKIAGLL